jgi:hypothetical protein
MADRYWVGGTGTWNTTSTTVWSATSGGASGASVPTAADDVFFNGSSGSGTITLTGALLCKSLTTTGSSFTFTSSGTLTVSGNITLSSTTVWSATGLITINAASTITTNTVTLSCAVTLNATGLITLGSSLTITGIFTFTRGTINLANNVLSCNNFRSNNGNTRQIQFGTGNITVTGSGTGMFAMGEVTNFSYTGTPTINISNNSVTAGTINFGNILGATEAQVFNFNVNVGTYALTISTSGHYKSLNFTGFTGTWSPSTSSYTFYGSLTLVSGMTFTTGTGALTFAHTSGTAVITSASKTLNPITVNGVGGTVQLADDLTLESTRTLTLTNGTFDSNNKNVTVGLFASSNSNVRTLNMGSGTWTLSGTGNVWNVATSTNLTFNPSTSTIVLSDTSATARTFAGGSLTYNNLTIGGTTGTSTLTFTGSNTFNTLSSTKTVAHTILFTASTTNTFTTFNINGTVGNVVTIGSVTASSHTLAKAGGEERTSSGGGGFPAPPTASARTNQSGK